MTFEPERYELREGPAYQFDLDRRDFFRALGGGIVVGLLVNESATARESEGGGQRGGGSGATTPGDLAAWLHIGIDGTITVFTGKTEVGQNIRTSLSQVVSEELHAPISAIRLVMADTDLTPFDQGTFGSRTTPTMAPQLRKVAASAREVLVDLAAEQWKVDRSVLVVEDGRVLNSRTKQALHFGQLTKGQKLVKTVANDVSPTRTEQWKVAGRSAPKVDGRSFVTGRHHFTTDIKRPGMLYGKISRPSAFGASLASFNGRAAQAIPGVTVVRDGEFIGVTAPSEQEAEKALATIEVRWNETPQVSQGALLEHLKKTADAGARPSQRGSVETGMSAADKKLQQAYTVQYIAHAPLEPRAAVAEWRDSRLTVWTGTQRPFGVRSELAQAFRIPESQVRVIVPDTGSGYGGKHTGEVAVEAARLAKAAGRPVKLVWTREEEFTWAYFRPAGVIEISSGIRNDGRITAWEFHNYNSGNSGLPTPYDIENVKQAFHNSDSPLRQGSYRGLAATANHFAREVHMDELARLAGMDPLEFRYKNLKDDRLRAVLEAAAERFNWVGRKKSPDRGFGVAGGYEKGGYISTITEIAIDRPSAGVRVVRATAAFECGAIVNPEQLKNQIEGSIVQGIGGALFEEITFENGRILNPKFSKYRVPRFSDTPTIEVVLIDRKDLAPAGAGETPIVGIAPALGNAIFDATGIRLRSLPMAPGGLKV